MNTTVSKSRTIPKLASGDRLTRDEFERRDTAMDRVAGHAEFVEALRSRSVAKS